jgi:hypothetical protein
VSTIKVGPEKKKKMMKGKSEGRVEEKGRVSWPTEALETHVDIDMTSPAKWQFRLTGPPKTNLARPPIVANPCVVYMHTGTGECMDQTSVKADLTHVRELTCSSLPDDVQSKTDIC